MNLDSALSDELFIKVLAYLGPRDLARLQAVSRRISNLAQDPQVWKRLFIQTFIDGNGNGNRQRMHRLPALTDLRALVASAAHISHPIKGLPRRYVYQQASSASLDRGSDQDHFVAEVLNNGLDWQALFRVSSNWQKGNYAVSELLLGIGQAPIADQSALTTSQPTMQPSPTPQRRRRTLIRHHPASNPAGPIRPDTLVQSSGDFIFTASRHPQSDERAFVPTIDVYPEDSSQTSPGPASKAARGLRRATPHEPMAHKPIKQLQSEQLRWRRSNDADAKVAVTDLRVDASPGTTKDSVRLFAAYSTGDFSVFTLCGASDSLDVQEAVFHASTNTSPSPIVMSSFQSPLLVTCTADFCISIYHIEDTASGVANAELLREMKSYTCHWPATMTLRQVQRREQGIGGETAIARTQTLGKRSRSPTRPRTFAGIKASRGRRNANPLIPMQSKSTQDEHLFGLDIAYCTPSYPDNWTVSLQEIMIGWTSQSHSSPRNVSISSRYATAGPRVKSAFPVHTTAQNADEPDSSDASDGETENKRSYQTLTPSPGRKAPLPRSIFDSPRPFATEEVSSPTTSKDRTVSISYDAPFMVVGSSDNTVDVYEVEHCPSTSTSTQGSSIALHHRRVLHGHMGSVLSVALDEGRCVSGSNDGTVMVWTLGETSGRAYNDIHHVVTLTPSQMDSQIGGADGAGGTVPTLRDLLEQIRREEQAMQRSRTPAGSLPSSLAVTSTARRHGAIKWVSTSFDRILSVSSSLPLQPCISGSAEQDSGVKGPSEPSRDSGERVQVWSFAA